MLLSNLFEAPLSQRIDRLRAMLGQAPEPRPEPEPVNNRRLNHTALDYLMSVNSISRRPDGRSEWNGQIYTNNTAAKAAQENWIFAHRINTDDIADNYGLSPQIIDQLVRFVYPRSAALTTTGRLIMQSRANPRIVFNSMRKTEEFESWLKNKILQSTTLGIPTNRTTQNGFTLIMAGFRNTDSNPPKAIWGYGYLTNPSRIAIFGGGFNPSRNATLAFQFFPYDAAHLAEVQNAVRQNRTRGYRFVPDINEFDTRSMDWIRRQLRTAL